MQGSRNSDQNREQGAVVILFSVLILVFFAFTALAIDLGLAASASHQAKSHAQLAALSSLERYFFTEGDHETRLAAALERANEVSEMNVVLGHHAAKEIDTVESDEDRQLLIPGRFFYQQAEGAANPCVAGEEAPCFVPYDGSAPVNAFRIVGDYTNDVPLKFASVVFGETKFPVNVSATATIVPRHGCFVVDLSRSMTADTHRGSNGFVYAYFRLPENPTFAPPYDDTAWANLNLNYPTRGSSPTVSTVHYADDYQQMSVISDTGYSAAQHGNYHPAPTDQGGEYSAGNVERSFQIDLFRNADYAGPQPLTTVFGGIDRALSYLQSRAVVGDMACMVFYDQTMNWARVFKLTDDFEYLRSFTDVSVTNDPDRGLLKAIRHGLFPFPDAKTNMLMGISEAMSQLSSSQNTGLPSSDFIVLIGDGQTNCFNCDFDPRFDRTGDGKVTPTDLYAMYPCMYPVYCNFGAPFASPYTCPPTPQKCAWTDFDRNGVAGETADYNLMIEAYYKSGRCNGLQGCNNMYENYFFSMDGVKDYVEQVVVPAKVPVHVMLVGNDSGPHTVDVADPDNPGQCLSEAEKRKRRNVIGQQSDFPTVKSGLSYTGYCYSGWNNDVTATSACYPADAYTKWAQKSEANPFYEPNVDLYSIATMTGGVWAPIRPKYASGQTTCTPDPCRPDLARRLTDPQCRTTDEQVESYIDEILGQNPFTLVIPKSDY